MQFKEWIEKSGKNQEIVARELGFTQADISRYCAGVVIPRPDRMAKIAEYTNDEVQPNDFYKNLEE